MDGKTITDSLRLPGDSFEDPAGLGAAIRVFIEGTPKAQPRHRTTKAGHAYTPPVAEGWRQRVAAAVLDRRPPQPHLGPVALILHYFMPRPAYHYGTGRNAGIIKPRFLDAKPTGPPDLDNLEKAVKDELQQLGEYRNDSQVCDVDKKKEYETTEQRPGLLLVVYLEPA